MCFLRKACFKEYMLSLNELLFRVKFQISRAKFHAISREISCYSMPLRVKLHATSREFSCHFT